MHLLLYISGGIKILLRQLLLSVSSIDFYKDVYQKYHGYGIRFLFTVSFIPAIIYCIFILNYIANLQDYLNGVQTTKVTDNIEYIINQLPEIKYADSRIQIEEKAPFYLYDKNNRKIVVIDPENQITKSEQDKIPLVLSKNFLKANWIIPVNFNYSEKFGTNQFILTQEIVKKYLADNLANIFISLGMPIIIVLGFIIFFFERSIMIFLVYIVSNLFRNKIPIQTATRLVMFSSGIPILLHPVILLIPKLGIVLQLVQMFTTYLIFAAVWQINKNREFSSYL